MGFWAYFENENYNEEKTEEKRRSRSVSRSVLAPNTGHNSNANLEDTWVLAQFWDVYESLLDK